MIEKERLNDRLIVLLLAGVLVINYPLLALFDKFTFWQEIPVLYLYLFGFWFVYIGLLAAVLSGRSRRKPSSKTKISHSGRTA
jgi:peptidoglycan/LPS O-acetylase OafA/YrhL